jgi:DeoR family transcriptional regulator of aga operon
LEAKVNRAMMDVSRVVVAACDSSKFGRRSLSLIAPTSAIHRVITDRFAPKKDVAELRKAGIEIILVHAAERHAKPKSKRWSDKREDS